MKYIFCLIAILFYSPIAHASNAVVLMYHRIDDKKTSMSISVNNFSEQMNYLSKNGYNVISSMDLVGAIERKQELPKKSIVITFDDGWKSQTNAMSILHKYHYTSQFALITQYILDRYPGYLSKEDVANEEEYGFIFVNHSRTHVCKDFLVNSTNDVAVSRMQLKQISPTEYPIYVYPYGLHNKNLEEALKKEGYIAAFGTNGEGVNTKTADIYNINRFSITDKVTLDAFIKIISLSL